MDKCYPFHSHWAEYESLPELAKSQYFQQLWKLPFQSLVLEAHSPVEADWRNPDLKDDFYAAVTQEFYELAAYFYQLLRDRPITVILQNWEGDWMLRGTEKTWNPAPSDWPQRCEKMQRWLAARQAGVTRARTHLGKETRCIVALAVEVNRVADAWKGIPTMTRHVLPAIQVDLVSYSAWDGINPGDPCLFWRCLEEIRQHAHTGPLFGPGAIAVGEFGIPENNKPNRIRDRYDEMLGVMLAANVRFAAQWEIYCNEFARKAMPPPPTPVTDPALMRGMWLVKPDGSLSEGGKYFHELWSRPEVGEKKQTLSNMGR
jgi:hypothetical protein